MKDVLSSKFQVLRLWQQIFYNIQVTPKLDDPMPSHRAHRYDSERTLGKPYNEVHTAIDRPFRWLGRKHRRLFHSVEEAYLLGALVGNDGMGGWAGVEHVLLDRVCTEHPEYRKFLEFQAKENARFQKFLRKYRRNMAKIYGIKKRKRKPKRKNNTLMNLTIY